MRLKVVVRRDLVDGGYVASCPALPGCHSQGDTLVEVQRNIRDAIHACLEALNGRAKTRSASGRIIEVAV